MAKSNAANFGKYFDLPNHGLEAYFARTRAGNAVEYRTPFYGKNTPVQSVISKWLPSLEVLKQQWPTLYQFEKDLAEKVGPLSIMKPLSERMEDIDHYYDDISNHQEPISISALAAVLKEWHAVRGMNVRSQRLTVDKMKKSTNSGSPYFTKRRGVTDKTVPARVWFDGDEVFQELINVVWYACAILGWRGQEGGPTWDDVKQRVVFMFPYAVNIQELQVYQPLIETAQTFHLVPAWISMELVDEHITRMFDTKGKGDLVVCTDFSKFDQHFGSSCQTAAHDLLQQILNSTEESRDWLSNVFPIKYMIPLAYDWERIRFGQHGMGSGSGGTNADETLVHRALQYEAAQSIGSRLNIYSQCLGDDGVLTFPGCTEDVIMDSYTRHGLEMNATKQYSSVNDCTYLRRWHHQDYRKDDVCVGVYSTCRALGRLCEQERYYDPDSWGAKMVALRQLSIIENVKWHPLRDEFARFCMKGDKYRLGIDIPGFLANIADEAGKAIDLMPDFLGYTKSMLKNQVGIDSWWIVNFLRSEA